MKELSTALVTPLYKISCFLDNKRRSKYQTMVSLRQGRKTRITYKSGAGLRGIQQKIRKYLSPYYDNLEYDKCIIGYREGLLLREELKKLEGFNCLIHMDIKKYYDNISMTNCVEALNAMGFNKKQADMLARMNMVYLSNKGNRLQQGSPAAPIIANFVGHHCFDKPIMDWIKNEIKDPKYSDVKWRYVRYSDNLLLAISIDDINNSKEFKDKYIGCVQKTCETHKFKVKPADIIPQNHPFRAQKFLGVILNKQARIDNEKFKKYRATLFNMIILPQNDFFVCSKNHSSAVYNNLLASVGSHTVWLPSILLEAVRQEVQGFISYLSAVSPKQATVLKNLLYAVNTVNMSSKHIRKYGRTYGEIFPEVFDAIKKYNVPEERYKEKIDSVFQSLEY